MGQQGSKTTINYVFISPHFPLSYKYFCTSLKKRGVNVFGIASDPYETLAPELQEGLTEYFQVEDLEDYDQVYRAVAFFISKYGRVHYIESHNEHWLETDARLREDFNVRSGYWPNDIINYQKKSYMKTLFREVGAIVAPGVVARSQDEVYAFVREFGLPIIAKPDRGVGASSTFKISNQYELDQFVAREGAILHEYFIEKFVEGQIVTFDGLADMNGDIVFAASMEYCTSPMESSASQYVQVAYHITRNVPHDMQQLGAAIVKKFNVKSRFFHFEFFRTQKGDLMPLEVNLRPPGGYTVDMWNYAFNTDVFELYTDVVLQIPVSISEQPSYYVCFASRRNVLTYRHPHEQVLKHLGNHLVFNQPMPELFRQVMGDYAYIFRTESKDHMWELQSHVQNVQ